jgi:tetratricopeptide (TPR) repeat protein
MKTSDLHQHGVNLREGEKYLEALEVLTKTMERYIEESNYEGLVDALKDRCLCWKHLLLLKHEVGFKILAQKDAEAMLAVSLERSLTGKLATSYFRLGEMAIEDKNYKLGITCYKKAIKYYPHPDAELGDYTYHLGEALFRAGNKSSGKKKILEGIKILKQYQDNTDSFVLGVWLSGAYGRLADLLIDDEPDEALKYLKIAWKRVLSDKRLRIRKRQIEALIKKFETRGVKIV